MVAIASNVPSRPWYLKLGRRGGLAGYFFVAPSLIFLFVFLIFPIIAALYYSFTDYDLMSPPRLAGFKNYVNLLDDNRFPRSVLNTLFFAAGTVPTGTVIALLLATLINRHIRAIYAFRAAFYLPVVSSFVAVSLIWLWMYEPQFGFFNDLLEAVGLPRLKWLRAAETSMLSIILLSVWKNMGLNVVIYLAGLQVTLPPKMPSILSRVRSMGGDGHETEQVSRGTDHRHPQRAPGGVASRRALPQVGGQRRDVLQVAVQVRRHGGIRRQEAEGAGG